MKNSKLLVILAGLNITSIIAKILVSFGNGYTIPQGWITGLILDVLSVYLLCVSEVKNKGLYFVLGSVVFVAVICFTATLAMLGLVQVGW